MQEAKPTLIGSSRPVKFTTLERFNQKLHHDSTSECIVWTGRKVGGYGTLRHNGNRDKWVYAHRVSWALHYGPIPAGKYVLHRCDNPPCVNPNHLFLGTLGDNIVDAISKGRWIRPRGEKHPRAKLAWSDVLLIRKSGVKNAQLAVQYGVHPSIISSIRRGLTWKRAA